MKCKRTGFTLIELLVVMGVISILTAIILPTLGKVRRQARSLLNVTNQKGIVHSVTLFATEHNDRYPESVAAIGVAPFFNWHEPWLMIAPRARSPELHRSMSAYLGNYIDDGSIMSCPNAPREFKRLQKAWDAGDAWNSPDTPSIWDPLSGTYCFYWNYIGFLGAHTQPFRGPKSMSGGSGQNKLLVSDSFSFDHWRSPNAFGSCEKFRQADVTPETPIASAYWNRLKSDESVNRNTIAVKFHAGYTDNHVEAYSASEVTVMNVSQTPDGKKPFEAGHGDIHIPKNCLR